MKRAFTIEAVADNLLTAQALNGRLGTRHTFNGALRQVETLARDLARAESTIYELVGSTTSPKDDWGDLSWASRTWKGRNGRTVTFTIRRKEDA